MVLQEFGGKFDPINVLSSWNIPQRLEAATRLAADSVAAKSGAGPSWHSTKTGSSSSSFSTAYTNMPIFNWSNTNNTDTLFEDDGIPMICSDDYNRLWNIYTTDNAVSSGESAIFAFNSKTIDANSNIQYPVNEAVLHTSSDHPHNYPVTSWETKRYTGKRSRDHTLLEPESSTTDSGFKLVSQNQPKAKKPRLETEHLISSSNINFQQASSSSSSDSEAIEQMKELVYHAAAFRPVSFSTEEVEVEKPKRRKNVRISKDPQTVAARQRRERISERIRILQKMVPGGSKMDTASMLDEAANYLKFLRTQVKAFEAFGYPLVNNLTSFSSIVPYFNYPFKA